MIVSYSKEEWWPVYMLSENVDPVFEIEITEELYIEYERAIASFRNVQTKLHKIIKSKDLEGVG